MRASGSSIKRTRKRRRCLDFQKGTCSYGSVCRFLHDEDVNDADDDSDRASRSTLQRSRNDKMCFDFQKGICTFGSDCRFLHEGEEIRDTDVGLSRPIRRPHYVKRCIDFQKGRCTYGSDCRFAHEEDEAWDVEEKISVRNVSNRLCLDYKKGRCTYGERCSFSHKIRTGGVGNGNNERGSSPRERERRMGWESPRERDRGRSKLTCLDFVKGRCTYGDDCRFSHMAEKQSSVRRVSSRSCLD